MTSNVSRFYDCNNGDKLADDTRYPPEICDYLEGERTVLCDCIDEHRYSGILEVGCMNGRNIDVALQKGIKYFGIDLVDRFIAQARKMILETSIVGVAEVCDVKDLSPIRDNIDSGYVAAFPFNSFGNIDDPKKALGSTSKEEIDILILTYNTDPLTNEVRRKYLASCGMSDLRQVKDNKGISFTSKEGLSSYAYFAETIRTWACNSGYRRIEEKEFAKIGKAYMCTISP